MEAVKEDDIDKLFLQMKSKLQDELEQEEQIHQDLVIFQGTGFTIKLPPEFKQENKEQIRKIFTTKNKPDTVLTHIQEQAGFTFQPARLNTMKLDLDSASKLMRQTLEQADAKNVFYEQGQISGYLPIVWFDYKSFAADERVYNILFLFSVEEQLIIGTFYCIFKNYDKWKPRVLNMLKLIKQEENI
ncbi:MAG: hypothetical protein ACRDBO_19780 [Lachnospiraceae bacterium]